MMNIITHSSVPFGSRRIISSGRRSFHSIINLNINRHISIHFINKFIQYTINRHMMVIIIINRLCTNNRRVVITGTII